MDYFLNENNIREYIAMVDGYDGRELIEVLKKFLQPGSTVLELGMGPGKDLDILNETYAATGSDYSNIFLDMYRENNKDADLLLLDARTLATDRSFDCIYSNKVLMHLTRDEMKVSFKQQKEILKDGGILFHSFWKGDKEETIQGVHFIYYEKAHLIEMVKDYYDVLAVETYTEMEENDSIYMIVKKKKKSFLEIDAN